jgi:type II secretory ATPase GspE/PulE/Tfp pilus assembly ATPase PilB-like protein
MSTNSEQAYMSVHEGDPRVQRGPSQAIIGLTSGRMEHHRLTRFAPRLSALPTANRIIPSVCVAFVGFLKSKNEIAPERSGPAMKVHLAGGCTFRVRPTISTPGGFFAVPEGQSPFGEIFFYEHAVNAQESDERLGDLLVREGLAAPEDVARGLAEQSPRLGQILVEQKNLDPAVIDVAVSYQAERRMRLGEVLIEAGLVKPADVERALAEQKRRGGKRLGEILVALGVVSERDMSDALARKFNLPFVDLEKYPIDAAAAREIPQQLIARYGFLPIASDENSFTVAISDPLFTEIADVLRFQLGKKKLREVMVTVSQLTQFVQTHLSGGTVPVVRAELGEILGKLEREVQVVEDAPIETRDEEEVSESAIVQLANQMILDAHRRGASDIHIEPNGLAAETMVRFRTDGECAVYAQLPAAYRNAIIARLKIMAQLDISERRKPQDGKIRIALSGKQHLELRVATMPTAGGNEDMVLRLLHSEKVPALDSLGFSPRNMIELRKLARQPYGLLLCVGPTGSGKTTTLHSMLDHLNEPGTKIWTAEDPIEITQKGLRQVQVQPKIGFDFAAALRSFLRCDPDVIMVGEMRDKETADIAVQAALTGHLVLSTLHTNSAPETLTRLLDMGLDPFSFSDSLLGILAQRLARALCPSCKAPREANDADRAELARFGFKREGEITLHHGKGCDACKGTGYRGRIALHELFVADEWTRAALQRRAPVDELRAHAREQGMTTLAEDGVQKALLGLTDLRQVLAVCSR